jgi:hypothetical protein
MEALGVNSFIIKTTKRFGEMVGIFSSVLLVPQTAWASSLFKKNYVTAHRVPPRCDQASFITTNSKTIAPSIYLARANSL